MPNTPVNTPSGYAPAFAIGFSDASGALSVVRDGVPLPVQSVAAPAALPLSGTSAAALVAGPFAPVTDRPVVITLSGTWAGTVTLRRSIDGGTTKLPVTVNGSPWGVFKGNACEPVWSETETGALLYLDIAPASGTVAYRLAQ